jgi:hypothetical protein
MSGNLTGPEGVLMLCVAGILDMLGFILFLLSWLGIDDFGVLDVLGMLIIGGWMFMRGGGLNKKIIKRGLRRFGFSSAIEIVPWLGGIAPSWTILVFIELKGSEEEPVAQSKTDSQSKKLSPQSLKT